MTRPTSATKLNMQAFTEANVPWVESLPLLNLERLAREIVGLQPDLMVNWRAQGEFRKGIADQMDMWLHLAADVSVPLTCQRCMGAVQTLLRVDQWYRFVATEDIAMAEDDASEEDLLVLTPQFDLLAVLEDELLMALPLVPMHNECPDLPAFSAGVLELPDDADGKPNPFAALAHLKKDKNETKNETKN